MEKEQQKLIICQGIPSSGKSTWAKQYVLESPLTRVRVNRDDIRKMLGKYWVPQRETLVSDIEEQCVFQALSSGYTVVLDATNLNHAYNKEWESVANGYIVEYKPFYISLEEAIERDSKRVGDDHVGEEVIKRFFNKYDGKF